MNPQIRDKFYDEFLKEPTKDNFRNFDVKKLWRIRRSRL